MREHVLNYKGKRYPTQDFESMYEVAQYLENIKDLDRYSLTDERELTAERHFYGISKFDGVLDRLKYGDTETTKTYLDKLKSAQEDGEEINNIHMDIEGFAYDMGAVVSGEPECCVNSGHPTVKPHLNIYIDTGYSGGVSPSVIANRGVAIYQLVSNLLSKGYLLDIWVVHYIDCSNGDSFCQRVKLSTEYLTVSQLAFAGRCEFFRVVTWLLTAIQKKDYRYTGSGKSEPSRSVVEELKKDGLFIPSGYTDGRFNGCSKEQALEYIVEIYNEFVGRQKDAN